MLDLVLARLRKEPLLAVGVLVSLVVFAAGELGIVLDEASVQAVLEPIVVAVIARNFVTPTKTA